MNTVSYTKSIINNNSLHAKKKYGQNFLIDDGVLPRIVEAAEITNTDEVIEIGPGLGNLTSYILNTGAKLTAFEIDEDMVNVLNNRFSENKKLTVEKQDILEVNLEKYFGDKKVKVVANIPYYITSPIIFKLLECKEKIESITLMVQKEVADRLVAASGTKNYSALTINVNAQCSVIKQFDVLKANFLPMPKVDSAIVTLIPEKKYDIADISKFSKLVKQAFSSKRKTLLNSLLNCNFKNLTKQQLNDYLKKMGIDGIKRPEQITVSEYVKLSNDNF